jgi:hypothetical protein
VEKSEKHLHFEKACVIFEGDGLETFAFYCFITYRFALSIHRFREILVRSLDLTLAAPNNVILL